MSKPRNYEPDWNSFRVAPPPDWWLRALFDFDPDIVVLPSRQRLGVFWLTRRLKWTAEIVAATKPSIPLDNATDAAMFRAHNVESVTDITTPCGYWAIEPVLKWLRDRDTWAYEDGPLDAAGLRRALANGGSKFTKLVEQTELYAEQKINAAVKESIYHATGDAWESLQRRKGKRINNAGMPKSTDQARPARPGSPILVGA